MGFCQFWREFQRPGRIPTELVAEREMHNALAVALGVETFDFAKIVESSHLGTPYQLHFERMVAT